MKRFLLLLWCAVSAFGAAGDVHLSINGDGWSGYLWVNGGATNGTLANGFATNNLALGSEKIRITLNAPGYDATGATGIVKVVVYGTKFVRFASPNDGFADTLILGSDCRIRFALSEFVYAADNSITADVASGTYGANNAITGLSVTNNSTQTYPMAIMQWDHIAGVCTYDRVKADFTVAANARHCYGVAAVKFDATGQTSSANVNATVSTQKATKRTATGLFAAAYQTTLAIAGFTQGERIDLRARVYPKRGDSGAVLDTNSYTTNSATECLGLNKATILCDKSAALDVIKYVAASGGSDANSGATGSRYATIGKGLANANIIYLGAGTHNAVGSIPGTRVTGNEWRIVQPEPGQDSTTVIVQLDTQKTYNTERVEYLGVKIRKVSTSAWLDGNGDGDSLRFVNCVFDDNGIGGPTVGFGYRSDTCYVENCTGDLGSDKWNLAEFSSARFGYQFDGVALAETSTSAGSINPWFRVVACTFSGSVQFQEHLTANPAPPQDNVFFDFNRGRNFAHTSQHQLSFISAVAATRGVSICGNDLEEINNNRALFWTAADSCAADANHVIVWCNTIAGNRWNTGYNDDTTHNFKRFFWSVRNNIFESLATKHDTFTGSGGVNAIRTNGWAVLYGVGWSGNMSAQIGTIGGGGSFAHEFIGMNSYQGAASGQPPSATPISTVNFFDREAYTGSAGTGNGTYRILSSSPVVYLARNFNEISFTLDGQAVGMIDAPGALGMASPRRGGFFF